MTDPIGDARRLLLETADELEAIWGEAEDMLDVAELRAAAEALPDFEALLARWRATITRQKKHPSLEVQAAAEARERCLNELDDFIRRINQPEALPKPTPQYEQYPVGSFTWRLKQPPS